MPKPKKDDKWKTLVSPRGNDGLPETRQVCEIRGVDWMVVTGWDARGGRLEPVRVTVWAMNRNSGLTGEALRAIPFGQMHRAARAAAGARFAAIRAEHGEKFAQRLLDLAPAFEDLAVGPGRGIALSDEELRTGSCGLPQGMDRGSAGYEGRGRRLPGLEEHSRQTDHEGPGGWPSQRHREEHQMRSTAPAPRKDPRRPGEWMFTFDSVHPTTSGGRRQVQRRGFKTKQAAQEALDEARRQDRVYEPRDGELTVGEVFADFIRSKRLAGKAPNTVAQYQWAAGIARDRWGGWPASKLSSELLDTAYEEMLRTGRRQYRGKRGTTSTNRPMSARSVEAFHKTLKAAFQLAVDKGHLDRNPSALATPPAVSEQARHWWTPEQVGAFLTYVAKEPCITLGLGETLVDTGGRRGEVLGLRWEDLDLDAGTATVAQQLVADTGKKVLTLRQTKRPRSRSVIGLHPDTVSALRRRKSQQKEDQVRLGPGWPKVGTIHRGLVFTWPDGRAIHPDVLTRTVERMSVAAGLPRLTPHGLRHSFATAAVVGACPDRGCRRTPG